MRTRRSLLAKGILDYIQAMFAQEPFHNDPKLIRSYAPSALHPDGAMYLAKPRTDDVCC